MAGRNPLQRLSTSLHLTEPCQAGYRAIPSRAFAASRQRDEQSDALTGYVARASSAGSGSGRCGAVHSHIHITAQELQRRGHQEPRRPPVAFATFSVSPRAATKGEQNEADAEIKAAGGKAHVRGGAEVPGLPWPDQTTHNGDRSRGSGGVLWCVHRDASCRRLPGHIPQWYRCIRGGRRLVTVDGETPISPGVIHPGFRTCGEFPSGDFPSFRARSLGVLGGGGGVAAVAGGGPGEGAGGGGGEGPAGGLLGLVVVVAGGSVQTFSS